MIASVTPSVCRRLCVVCKITFSRTPHSFFILACSNFTGMCKMTLPTNVNFQKWVLGSKNFLKNYFSEKWQFLRTTHSFFIWACSNFTGMCKMILPKNMRFQKRVLGSKNSHKVFLKKWLFFANYSFIFHPSLLKFYRHVQNDLAQKCKFSKMGFGVQKLS